MLFCSAVARAEDAQPSTDDEAAARRSHLGNVAFLHHPPAYRLTLEAPKTCGVTFVRDLISSPAFDRIY